AILVAVIGLVVNLVSAALLMHPHGHGHQGADAHGQDDDPDHAHEHADDHDHDHAHGEHHDAAPHPHPNLIAAYVHVLADAVTSVLAIAALVAGRYLGWVWLDA